jgi:glycosyltransferase involved in cell wall biosynthesis
MTGQDRPLVSIVICTWNRAESLRQTLESLAGQKVSGGVNVEVVVVDNNSSDQTRCVVTAAQELWPLGKLEYVFEPRQGKQFALNTGIEKSNGGILAFTDDDIIFPFDWIASILKLFEDENLDLAGGKTLPDWSGVARPEWYSDSMMAVLAGVDLGDTYMCPPPEGYAPAGSNMVLRRRLLERVGRFSESHFRHMDYDFGRRCVRLGVTVAYAPSLVVNAPVDGSILTQRYFRRWSFKAGIARDDEGDGIGVRKFLGVPSWIFRQVAEDWLYLVLRARSVLPAQAFARELRLSRGFGTIASRWHAWLRPGHHAQWVAKYSQKKKDMY